MDPEQVAAFRLARQGLDARRPLTLAAAAACPASDFQRGSALLALAARADGVSRGAFDAAVATGELIVAPSLRAAIHVVAPADEALFGRGLVATEDGDLGEQLGVTAKKQLQEASIRPSAALAEVTEATAQALADRGALTKDELHEALRGRVRPALLPWCKGCGSHHVAPMLWRYAAVMTGARLDTARRYRAGEPAAAPGATEAVRRFLRAYGPATVKEFTAWAGVARAHGRALWGRIAGELAEVRIGGRTLWLLGEDEAAFASPPRASGTRLLPPRDPYLQHPDRSWIAPDAAVARRLFRPVAAPGAVLCDGRLAGLWRVRAKGRRAELTVEALGDIDAGALEAEAARIAQLRGAERVEVLLA